jgi:hypothetical protein
MYRRFLPQSHTTSTSFAISAVGLRALESFVKNSRISSKERVIKEYKERKMERVTLPATTKNVALVGR